MQEHSTAHTRTKSQQATSYQYRRVIASTGGSSHLMACLRSGLVRGCGEAGALKLDTWTLEGKTLAIPRPEHVPYSDKVAYKNRPINYPIYEHAHNYRAKVQEFSAGGFEVVITSIHMQQHSDRAALHLPRGARTERKGDQESIEKARRRAKRSVRLKCKEMGADHLTTFTTRRIKTRSELVAIWGRFMDLLVYHFKRKFPYVCVCEPHPTNPIHLHLHAAIRGRLSIRELAIARRCWYVALGGSGKEKGADAPGGLNIKQIRVKGGAHKRMDKIASYLSKYITKDDGAEFNKKRYWCSRIDLKEARAYWLKARTIEDALQEFCVEFDFSPSGDKSDFFRARNIDVVWMRYCPDDDSPVSVPF